MQKSQVALIRCDSYDQEDVSSAIEIAMELLGGFNKIFKKNEKILLKPNLLSAQTPEKAITTHPSVFYGVAEYLRHCDPNLKIYYGDSSPKGTTAKIINTTGIEEKAKKLNIGYADFEVSGTYSNPNGILHKQFTVAKAVREHEALINIAKFKTHHLTRISGAIKNLFGTIPGLMKPEFHVKLPGVMEFSRMLVELNLFLNTRLHVIDAIECMEGNGPKAGRPRNLNCIIVSTDPVAADSVACRLIDVKPDRVLTNLLGTEYGLGTMENIEVVGDDISDFIDKDFEVQRGVNLSGNTAWKYRYLKNLISLKPVINQSKCIKCGECVNHCPVKPLGIEWKKRSRYPVYNYQNCIRCYCCQEVCPEGAIDIKTPIIRQIIDKVYS